MKTSVHAIEADALVKTYGDVRALDGLSLAVPAGTVFGLLGPNGAGKSTTVRILTTLSRADSGAARVAGHDVLADPAAVRRAIGCVGQRSGVDLEATGAENLILQGQIHGLRGRDLAARVAELLDQFGLSRGRRAAGEDLLGRHAAAARHRHGARAPPARAVPRRADDRARPRGAGRDVA